MTVIEKLEKAIEATKKAHPDDRNFYNALYGCGIEGDDCEQIMKFLASRIEDQYYTHAPDKLTQTFIDRLREMSKIIKSFVIM